jgi:uncharacterized membrane protein
MPGVGGAPSGLDRSASAASIFGRMRYDSASREDYSMASPLTPGVPPSPFSSAALEDATRTTALAGRKRRGKVHSRWWPGLRLPGQHEGPCSMPAVRHPVTLPVCQICGKPHSRSELVPAALVRPGLVARIRSTFPSWSQDGYICHDDLNRFRGEYVQFLLEDERGELSSLERSVIESLARHETLAQDVEAQFQKELSLGERLADGIADFGGSWTFILLFAGFIVIWVAINTVVLILRPFDPFPFILLNLMLSCLAALQAPIIMMSQNRQEARDRLRSENDYRVNLKAELEIRQLHEKLDHLLLHQWERLVEIQQIQIELMNELTAARRHGR